MPALLLHSSSCKMASTFNHLQIPTILVKLRSLPPLYTLAEGTQACCTFLSFCNQIGLRRVRWPNHRSPGMVCLTRATTTLLALLRPVLTSWEYLQESPPGSTSHHQLRPTIGSLEHFMKGLPSRERIHVPCWQLRKINQLKSAGNGREYVIVPRRVFIQSRVPKKLMTLELFYLSHANSRMAIRVAPANCRSDQHLQETNGVPNEIIRTNSSTWNPFKNNSKGNNHQSGTPQTSGSFSETNC